MLRDGDVAVQEDAGVAGGVEGAMESTERLVGQMGDIRRIASGVEAIDRIGKEVLLQRLVHEAVRG